MALSALLMFGACGRPSSTTPSIQKASSQDGVKHLTVATLNEKASEVTYERVLEIAKSKKSDAKPRLEKLLDDSTDRRLQMFARRILGHWDDQANTFYSKVPQALESTCIDTEEVKKLFPGEAEATRAYVEVRVDADGKPVRASVIGGTEDKALKDALTHSLMQKRYVPAKEGDSYVDATLTLECRLEVR
jgi:hypothetical protein